MIGGPKGPAENSEFEHSSIPATIKKMFNLSSNFLTHRDAWAGTFEHVVGDLSAPRTDCPGTHSPFSCQLIEFLNSIYLNMNYNMIKKLNTHSNDISGICAVFTI